MARINWNLKEEVAEFDMSQVKIPDIPRKPHHLSTEYQKEVSVETLEPRVILTRDSWDMTGGL